MIVNDWDCWTRAVHLGSELILEPWMREEGQVRASGVVCGKHTSIGSGPPPYTVKEAAASMKG